MALVAGTLAAGASAAAAQDQASDATRSTRAGVYTNKQAASGRETYQLSCVACHTPASHTGPAFSETWTGRPLWELYQYVSNLMPKNEPGSLFPEEYAGVVAYLLKMNGMPAGKEELLADPAALRKIRIEIARQ
jgi:mono/diheme cytochrome c family protein